MQLQMKTPEPKWRGGYQGGQARASGSRFQAKASAREGAANDALMMADLKPVRLKVGGGREPRPVFFGALCRCQSHLRRRLEVKMRARRVHLSAGDLICLCIDRLQR